MSPRRRQKAAVPKESRFVSVKESGGHCFIRWFVIQWRAHCGSSGCHYGNDNGD